MTSYKKWFKKYENFSQNVNISSIIHENDVITSSNLKKSECLINYILIKNASMVKVAKKVFAENLHDNPFLKSLSAPLIRQIGQVLKCFHFITKFFCLMYSQWRG